MLNQLLSSKMDEFMSAVDSGYQMKFAEEYAQIGDHPVYGGKHACSDAEVKGAQCIADELKKLGLQNVELIPLKATKYQFNDAVLTVIGSADGVVMKPYAMTSPATPEEGIVAEIIDAGFSRKEFYDKHDVSGKVVLIEAMGVLEGASLSAQCMQAEIRGAAAVICFATEDVWDEDTIRVHPMNHIPKIPLVSISLKDVNYLKQKMTGNEAVQVCLKTDTEYIVDGGTSYSVIGEIPGQIDERIFFSGHLDHYFKCMQDNISSVVTLLGIAKAMMASGYKPYRTMTFIFNGSHETGMSDSRYPYISGSYKLLQEAKKDWCGKTVLDINFEYSALSLDYLSAFGSQEISNIYDEFLESVPKEMPGFKCGTKPACRDEYMFLAWADTISYIASGIPTIMNDALHEQIYELTSPYIGRDHSNHDNMDVFDADALCSATKHFGALAIYADNLPLAQYDFSERLSGVSLSDEEKKTAGAIGISVEAFISAERMCEEKAKVLFEKICSYNREHRVGDEGSVAINREILAVYKMLVDAFDKLSSGDALTTAHAKHLADIRLLADGKTAIENGEVEMALNDIFAGVDIGALSKSFDREIAQFMQERINGKAHAHRRLWARERELSSLSLYDVIQGLKEKRAEGLSDYARELQQIDAEIKGEAVLLDKALKEECRALKDAADAIDKIIGKL